MEKLVEALMEVYLKNGIEVFTDWKLKQWNRSTYIGIGKQPKNQNPKRMSLLYAWVATEPDCLIVIIPRSIKPEQVRKDFGFDCTGDPINTVENKSKNHYGVFFPIGGNRKINGKFSPEDMEAFLIQMALLR